MDAGEPLDRRAARLIEELGIARAAEVVGVRPLTGGVASDIAAVTLADGRGLCVKFALPRLRVAVEWQAPVRRNRAEYLWLQAAGRVVPGAVPRLHGWSAALNGFAMEYVAGEGVRLWKASLLQGAPERGEAAAVGEVLGRIHAASVAAGFDRAGFDNAEDFRALRVEPYLLFTATRHPEVPGALEALAAGLEASRVALVHGDVSPKNILFRGGAPLLLDAECATMGDPAFDLAFCLNHLVLKAVHVPAAAGERVRGLWEFWVAYAPWVGWEAAGDLEARVARLVPGLMLARVDGRSPVEYLSEEGRAKVRALALRLLHRPPGTLGELVEGVS